jgi:hypothetical protein
VKVTWGDGAFTQTAVVPEIVAVGSGSTVTVALPPCDCVQVVELASRTLTSEYVYVPAVDVDTGIVTLFPVDVEIVWFEPLFTVNVNVYGAVPLAPVNVTTGDPPSRQTEVVPNIVAVGRGLTVTVAVPD